MTNQLLFTEPEAARELGLETSAVRLLVHAGTLGCYRYDAEHLRIGRSHIDDYKQRQHDSLRGLAREVALGMV